MTTIYLSLGTQVAKSTFFMKFPVAAGFGSIEEIINLNSNLDLPHKYYVKLVFEE